MTQITGSLTGHRARVFALVAFALAGLWSVESEAQDKSPVNVAIQEHIDRGIRFGNAGDFEKAISEFKQVLRIDPKNIHAYNNLGVVYFRLGEIDRVITAYTKAIDLGIADANMYFYRGLMYGKYKGEDAKAIKDYSRAIELDPKYSRAYLDRALSYSFLKMPDKAIADYNKMVELRPGDLRLVLGVRAQAYFEKRDYAMAWADVKKAKELGLSVDGEFIEKLREASPPRQNRSGQ